MPQPTRKSPFFTKISTAVQKLTKHEPYSIAHATLKATFLVPTTLSRILLNIATQPLPTHERNIRETSDQFRLPGYWVAPLVASYNDLPQWENDHESYDILLIYCHGGGFAVGHSLMYSVFMNHLLTHTKLRIRIYTIEYPLPSKIKALTRYPYQHRALLLAYKKLLEMGVPAKKMVFAGDSSGAFNVLRCFEEIIEEEIEKPGGVVLISPLVDLWTPKDKEEAAEKLEKGNSLELNGKKDYVTPKFLQRGLKLYQAPLDTAPIRKGAAWYAERLPKTFLTYGTGEIMLDSIRQFEAGLSGKVDLTTFVGREEAHVFNVLEPKFSRTKQVWEDAGQNLAGWLGRIARDV